MNTKTYKIKITTELRDYIESLHYEVESRKSLLTFAMEKGLTNTDSFREYHKEYRECFVMYEQAKHDLEESYVKPTLDEDEKADWELIFSDCEIVVRKEE